MKRLFVSLAFTAMAIGLATAGCTQAPPPAPTAAPAKPAAAPTTAPAAPTAAPKVAEPTKAAAPAQPTAAPAAKVNFPEKGKSITILVGFPPGGPHDVLSRLLAPVMEKDLGVPIQVVNKSGASGQQAWTEVAVGKPDGYTMTTWAIPSGLTTYLDPARGATYARKDFQPIALSTYDALVFGVKADSPYQGLKDLVDAAKAKPDTIKAGTPGLLSVSHLAVASLEDLTGARFTAVHFEGASPMKTAVLGGHVDVVTPSASNLYSEFKNGSVRILGVANQQEYPLLSGVKTFEAQGFKINTGSAVGFITTAGTPMEITNILSNSIKKAMETAEVKQKLEALLYQPRYMNPTQYAEYWAGEEKETIRLMGLIKR